MSNCFRFKKKEIRYGHNQDNINDDGNRDREIYESIDVVIAGTTNYEKFTEDIWIYDSGAFGHYCNSSKGLFNVEEIKKSITVSQGKSTMATKVKSLKCRLFKLFALDKISLSINSKH
jgi:hypothetical protein